MPGKTKNVDWEVYAAELYDSLLVLIPYQEYLNDIVAKAAITTSDVVLDAGCGTGNVTEKLHKLQPAEIWAIDSSSKMLQRAESKCTTNVQFVCADLSDKLSFEDNMFDVITCGNVLYTVKQPQHMLHEFYRILQPQGRLVLTTPRIGYENGLILKAHAGSTEPDAAWLGSHTSTERDEELINKTFDRPETRNLFLKVAEYNRTIRHSPRTVLHSESSLKELLLKCGFSNIDITSTYAGQTLLAHCRKEDDHAND